MLKGAPTSDNVRLSIERKMQLSQCADMFLDHDKIIRQQSLYGVKTSSMYDKSQEKPLKVCQVDSDTIHSSASNGRSGTQNLGGKFHRPESL
jgi:hypothetical protein